MGGATRGGTAEPTSRDQNTRHERGQGRGVVEKSQERRKSIARKRRRRGRAGRRLLRQSKTRSRARARGREITLAMHNVRAIAVDGTHEAGRVLDALSVYDRLGCDIIGLKETRRSVHSAFSQARPVQRLGGRGCKKFVPVLGGDGTKIALTGDISDQSPDGMS